MTMDSARFDRHAHLTELKRSARTLAAALAASALLVFTAACDQQGQGQGQGLGSLTSSLSGDSYGNPGEASAPIFQSRSTDLVPVHVQAATAALVMRMRGASAADVADKLSVDGAGIAEPDPAFDYAGFALSQVKIMRNTANAENPNRHHFAGLLQFESVAGRRALAAFEAEYEVVGDRIQATKLVQAPVFPEDPLAEMYIVPVQQVRAGFAAAAEDYDTLHKFVVDNAVSLTSQSAASAATDYLITVFYKDRLAPDGKVEVNLSSKRAGLDGEAKNTLYSAYDGWVVGVIAANFPIDATDSFWVKAIYTPGSTSPDNARNARIVGLFSTRPGQRAGG